MSLQPAMGLEVRDGEPAALPTPSTTSKDTSSQTPSSAATTSEGKTPEQTKAVKKARKEKCSKKYAHCKSLKKKGKSGANDRDQFDTDDDSGSDSDSDSSDSDQEPEVAAKPRRSSKRVTGNEITLKNMKLKKSEKSARLSRRMAAVSDINSGSSSDSSHTSDAGGKKSSKSEKNLISEVEKLQHQISRLSLQMTQAQQQLGGQLNSIGLGDTGSSGLDAGTQQLLALRNLGLGGTAASNNQVGNNRAARRRASTQSHTSLNAAEEALLAQVKNQEQKASRNGEPVLDFKRVDHVWDNSIHDYRLQDTAAPKPNESYDDYVFHVRRHFDWEGKYLTTYVDIKSKPLRECLQEVIGDVKGLSLVDEVPKLDPNLLFLYLAEFRGYLKVLKKSQPTSKDKHERKKQIKHIATARKHLKVLVRYLDNDYADIKKSLYPMLENGLITFELLWALWKPNTLAYTSTYGSPDEPRVFKVDVAEKHKSMLKGVYYYIEGKYFEYDGKQFGYGNTAEEVTEFRGARKITSLAVSPLEYHKNEPALRKRLIERGKKFVALAGVQYKSHQGMAYMKVKKQIKKHNVNGRIMIDAHVHRRINPNYPVSTVRPKEHDCVTIDEDSSGEEGCGDGCGSDDEQRDKMVTRAATSSNGLTYTFLVRKDEIAEDPTRDSEVLESIDKRNRNGDDVGEGEESGAKVDQKTFEFTEDDYLIASPVVLGFAFADKMWLEFTVSGVKDIQWNEKAWDSLVLPAETKSIVKALVKTHKYNAAESIDDVIQGKGKGLVAVLHGPPGTGKTLTAEGISELLKCPLYMVSAGELGTDSRYLEMELQRILDICHAWGAILLLDEADIFLEKRNMHDIHRNAMVSIFLRQLEYFQGILFLTTNRVETFDDAFQSRIHIALRYGKLDPRAKKAIFRIFIERVRAIEKTPPEGPSLAQRFTDDDLSTLARHDLNGREIKNTVGTAQALAVNKGEVLSMKHIREVLNVQMSFDRDLKGGPGFEDAMRGYF